MCGFVFLTTRNGSGIVSSRIDFLEGTIPKSSSNADSRAYLICSELMSFHGILTISLSNLNGSYWETPFIIWNTPSPGSDSICSLSKYSRSNSILDFRTIIASGSSSSSPPNNRLWIVNLVIVKRHVGRGSLSFFLIFISEEIKKWSRNEKQRCDNT